MKKLILIIDDEVAIREMVKFALGSAEFDVREAENTLSAERQIAKNIPNIILLDWMLPGMNGVDFAQRLKKNSKLQQVPIIMLTAKAEESSKLKAFSTGVDDYITKPFSPRELVARIKTVLRRGALVTPEGVIQVNNLRMDVNAHQVTINDVLLKLSPTEYRMLHFFVTHQNRVYSRAWLLDHIWGGEAEVDERTIDVHIRRLRSQLHLHGYDHCIQTVRGAGYQFVCDGNS